MTTSKLTPVQLRERGYAALVRELGPIDFIRFMQQFEPAQGDYTKDRAEWLDQLTPEQINQIVDKQKQRGR